jgi:hypothetical protein
MAGTWKPLVHQPTFNASTMLLLTDGSIMCQASGGLNWYILKPDAHGDYINGAWTPTAPMLNTRLYYASAVLSNGNVIVCGGEYSNAGSETNKCELYNPSTNSWTAIAPPPGWTNIGDAPCCVLPDGRFLLGYYNGTKTAFLDPHTLTWTAGPNKLDSGSEETWTLLPDQTVLTPQCQGHPKAEKYVIPSDKWVSAGTIPVDLVEASSIEIGPGVLLPDGRTFYVGATGHTAIYTLPSNASLPGTWIAGPDIPKVGGKTIGAKDAPGCLLPNGKVLFIGGPVDGVSNHYLTPTYFYEFDGVNIYRVPDPASSGSVPFAGRMMLTPSGQVLFANGTNQIYCYIPDGAPDPVWKPSITSSPFMVRRNHTYTLEGRQLNGLSQAVAYGDDAASATNYPIVKIVNTATGGVFFCKTFDHSSMGVNTGTIIHSTNFLVPASVPPGSYLIYVIANGISSDAKALNVTALPVVFDFTETEQVWNNLVGSLADGPLWVWGKEGPIPVDPWGPDLEKQASEARKQMLAGMKKLEELGSKLSTDRYEKSLKVAPAVDDEDR